MKHQNVIPPCELTSMSYLMGSISGVLTAHSMRLTTPSIAKRALGPHLGDFYEKFFPYWKCPKIFCNTRKGRKEMMVDKVKVSSGIAGLMSYDPGRMLVRNKTSMQRSLGFQIFYFCWRPTTSSHLLKDKITEKIT